jgi:hypothetical protein
MGEYDSSLAVANKLITKKGQPITVRTVIPPAEDPDQPWNGTDPTNQDQVTAGVFLNYDQKLVDGTTIRMGDQQVYARANTDDGVPVVPKVGGFVLRGTEQWKIINVQPLNPAGVTLMYQIQVRQ